MIKRRFFIGGAASILAAAAVMPRSVAAQSIAETLNKLGPEGHALEALAGSWDVTETVWDTPDAKPTVTKAVAIRRMLGSLLQEILHPAEDLSHTAISRIDYLSFNRVEGRWNYVSMDLRAPVGIMTANSFDRDPAERITVVFNPFALPGDGASVSGQLLRMDQVIETLGPNTSRKDQHFILADGTGRKWLAHRYDYRRRT